MNAILRAQNAYGLSNRSIRTARDTEYEAVARATQNLKSAADTNPLDMAKLARAVSDNRELWTLFAVQVADTDNPLPAQLRASIFYLAEFTNAHSSKVLSREASVDALIEINTAVMRGLRDAGPAK
ncbi:flagellar protein FlaF [Roseovarius nanhaiticus]|uniref:Flagellar protein FlaF n=1 Tax=Roseovarius nanhaiticus TaxID=573024 RepID=A0A1N7HL02_9RHOB|nr:flagellar biosynthesis regulator FlaF [Roseovarius nanhaiticus]SEL26538.1 flagellar protein FlaF [Roseovarius nanhaiticus]SIS25483.1 flagellar protein FlaF [Roseovarius nanhaiticus]